MGLFTSRKMYNVSLVISICNLCLTFGYFVVGEYAIIVSTFTPQNMGQFTLRVEGSHRFELTPIPQEGAGMFSKIIRGSW